jgi:ATP-dependent Clp protease adapter protein ClpS
VLHNDDLNTFEYVIGVLRKVFHYDTTTTSRRSA